MRCVALACCIAAAAMAQESEMRAILPRLGSDDYRTREDAERALEALVRDSGQAAFDILESQILPDVRAGGDAEVALRVRRVVNRLGTTRLLWWRQLGVTLEYAPRVAAGDGVVVRSGTSGLDVLDARTGETLWTVAGWFEKPLPGIAKGVVYLNRPPDAVAARRAKGGELVWAHEVGDIGGDSGRTHKVMIAAPGTFVKEERPLPPSRWTDHRVLTIHVAEWERTVVFTNEGKIVALDPDGRRVWSASADTWPNPCVAADLGLIFATDGKRLVALDARTGETKWSVACDGGPADAAKGRLLVTAAPEVEGRLDGRLYALDARTGALLWTFRPPVRAEEDARGTIEVVRHENTTVRRGTIPHAGDETRLAGAHAVAGGEVVVTQVRSHRFGLRASDGELLWKAPRDGIRTCGVEKDGLVWGTSDRGEIVAVDPRDGSVARRIDLMELEAAEDAPKLVVQRDDLPATEGLGDLAPPVFDGDTCYVATASGLTVALRIAPFRSHAER